MNQSIVDSKDLMKKGVLRGMSTKKGMEEKIEEYDNKKCPFLYYVQLAKKGNIEFKSIKLEPNREIEEMTH